MNALELLERLCFENKVGLTVIHDILNWGYQCTVKINSSHLDIRRTLSSDIIDRDLVNKCAQEVFNALFIAMLTKTNNPVPESQHHNYGPQDGCYVGKSNPLDPLNYNPNK